jgi:hypothetical protein
MSSLAPSLAFALFTAGAAALAALPEEKAAAPLPSPAPILKPLPPEVIRGLGYLVERQGEGGGFGLNDGQDPDVANTAIAALALVQSGHTPGSGDHRASVRKAVEFILKEVEAAPAEGPRVTAKTGTQPQSKVGPLVDTFLAGMLLGEVDGKCGDAALDARVRAALAKCVKKTEASQQPDGSWNQGGWAPVLGTAFAQQCLVIAEERGIEVDREKLERANAWARRVQEGGTAGRADSAGVELYANNATLGILAATGAGGAKPSAADAAAMESATKKLGDEQMLRGFGSNGGEEYVSFMMASTSLAAAGGEASVQWDANIRPKLASLQNADGSWAGHHCITGRVFCTASAILTLTADRKAASEPSVAKSEAAK